MAPRRWFLRVAAAALPVLLIGCFDEPGDSSNLVFGDALAPGLSYQPFEKTKQDAVTTVSNERHQGNASLRYSIPSPGEPGAGANNYSGGAFTSERARDLSQYTALTFWARASRSVAFDSLGLGNDNTGGSLYQTEWKGVPMTTAWTRYLVPIPAPRKLAAERGIFWLAAGAQGSPASGFQVWFDDVQYETLDASAWNPRPELTAATKKLATGETYQVVGTAVTYAIDGTDQKIGVFPSTFDYQTSDPGVATVSTAGLVTAVGIGTATISASMGGLAVGQTVTINIAGGTAPLAGPPAPTLNQADVISLYSDSYTNVPVDKFGADWSNGCTGTPCPRLSEVLLGGNHAYKYTDLLFAGIEFLGAKVIDATTMTSVHLDVWTHDATVFKLKLVDFGANGVYDLAGDDKSDELTFTASSSPAFVPDQWVSLDIPLSRFAGLTTRAHLAQVIVSSSTATVYIDNLYFHR